MKGISLQISNENGQDIGLSPDLLDVLTKEGWTIDNIETF